jgi:hypothetical protein
MQIADFNATSEPTDDGQAVVFSTELQPSPIELQTWMLDSDGNSTCGAYYAYVSRDDGR